jgi:hypothetical protein
MQNNTVIYEILVPCQWNNGVPIRTSHHKEWDKKVLKISGGLTILKPVKGQWKHEGEMYEDRVIPVRIRCTQEQMDKIATMTLEHYEQLAVLTYVVSDSSIIHLATSDQRSKFKHIRNNFTGKEAHDQSSRD